jgi:hypothetical protein
MSSRTGYLGLWAKCQLDDTNLAVGVFYIPHENSKHWKSDLFNKLADDLRHPHMYSDNVLVMGDFNARTGVLGDYVDAMHLANNDMSPSRWNMDTRINTNGRQLVDLCKACDMLIVNGRVGTDAGVGDFTCRTFNGASTVDYFLLSIPLFNQATDMAVLPFDRCTSDVHLPIVCTFNTTDTITEREQSSHLPPSNGRHWNRDTEYRYRDNFDLQQLDTVNTAILDHLTTGAQPDTQMIYQDINDLIIKAARGAGALKRTTGRARNSWFDKECREHKRDYRRAWHMACKSNDNVARNNAHKTYKRFIRGKNARTSTISIANFCHLGARTLSPTGHC